MAIPSFPRLNEKGYDRATKVLEIERMYGHRARFHVYYTVDGILHTHASWGKSKQIAADSMAEIAQSIHRGARYALIGVIALQPASLGG